MDRETVIRLPKKILKLVLVCKFGEKAYCTGRRIYNMIPKFDKITGIDTDVLIESCKRN